MKYTHFLAAIVAAVAGFGAVRAEALGVEQPLSISFIGRFQGLTTINRNIEKTVINSTSFTTASIVKAIAADLGTTNVIGGRLKLRTDLETQVQSVLIRKGTNVTDVTSFFGPGSGTNLFNFTNVVVDIRFHGNGQPVPIRFIGLETVALTSTNLSFNMSGFADGYSQQVTRRNGTTNLSVLVKELVIPSAEPGPAAAGTFTFNASTNSAPNLVSGPATIGFITLGAPDMVN